MRGEAYRDSGEASVCITACSTSPVRSTCARAASPRAACAVAVPFTHYYTLQYSGTVLVFTYPLCNNSLRGKNAPHMRSHRTRTLRVCGLTAQGLRG